MRRSVTVAPKERVNIVYRANSDIPEDVEIPLKFLMMGDYIQRDDPRPLENREPVSIDKDNFNDVMKAHDITLDLTVRNKLDRSQKDEDVGVQLKFKNIRDFEPDRLAKQIPALQRLLAIRDALVSLKSPLGNVPDFRRKLAALLNNPEMSAKLCQELGIEELGDE